ncbi:MAG: GNAT family N-acetyltransferase [Candidatus Woesearchaeota archaeon]
MVNLKFVRVNKDNFDEFSQFILLSEEVFPDSLAMSLNDYKDIASNDRSVCFVLFLGDDYVGNVFGCPLIEEFEQNQDAPVFDGCIYWYNIVVLSSFQGRGFGFLLAEKFIESCKDEGFKFVSGNFRLNGSYKLAKKFNVVFERVIENWEGSGEDFVYCVIKL